MSFSQIMILLTNVLLLTDVIYSFFYFKYNYFIDIRRRFSQFALTSAAYKEKVLLDVGREIGTTRNIVNVVFFVWIIVCLCTGGVLYPLLVLGFNTVVNFINKNKVLIHPIYFLLSLLFTGSVHFFVLLNLFGVI
jgi:hypothetical protein